MAQFDGLACETITQILDHLKFRDIFRAALVCKYWRSILFDLIKRQNIYESGNILEYEHLLNINDCTTFLDTNEQAALSLLRLAYNKGIITASRLLSIAIRRNLSFHDLCYFHGLLPHDMARYHNRYTTSIAWLRLYLRDATPNIMTIKALHTAGKDKEGFTAKAITHAVKTRDRELLSMFNNELDDEWSTRCRVLPPCEHHYYSREQEVSDDACMDDYNKIMQFLVTDIFMFSIDWTSVCNNVISQLIPMLNKEKIIEYLGMAYKGCCIPNKAVIEEIENKCRVSQKDLWVKSFQKFLPEDPEFTEYMTKRHPEVIYENMIRVVNMILGHVSVDPRWIDVLNVLKNADLGFFEECISSVRPEWGWDATNLSIAHEYGYAIKIHDLCYLKTIAELKKVAPYVTFTIDDIIKHWETCRIIDKKCDMYRLLISYLDHRV